MASNTPRVSTGIAGLDEILRGGWISGRAYLARGGPGTGKTTLGMHFIAAGIANQEKSLIIGFAEPATQIRAEAAGLGIGLDGCEILDMTPAAETFSEMQVYDIFSPVEVERDPISQEISEQIQQIQPQRIFVDGFSQFRHLATDPFHFRRLIQSFFRFATSHGGTLLVAAEDAEVHGDQDLQSTADGVITLEHSVAGRAIFVTKFRGSDFHSGPHPMRLTDTGVIVLPRAA